MGSNSYFIESLEVGFILSPSYNNNNNNNLHMCAVYQPQKFQLFDKKGNLK